jgi:hypothetical protein
MSRHPRQRQAQGAASNCKVPEHAEYAHHLLMQHRSIIQAIQATDGFKYSERSAQNKEGGDGARLKYVCQDSLQNRDRKSNVKIEKLHDGVHDELEVQRQGPAILPTYDCGGAIHIKLSLKRDAINVVYKHNPIHTTRENHVRYVPSAAVHTTDCQS